MERIPDRIDSTFRYVLVSARRAEQLIRGAQPRVEMPAHKPTRIAMREIADEVIDWDYGPPPVEEPPVAEQPAEVEEPA